MSMTNLTLLDKAFIKYIAKQAGFDAQNAFVLLVDAIAKGNGQYITDLCKDLGCPNDMVKAAQIMVSQ